MSGRLMEWAIQLETPLSHAAVRVLMVLAKHANDDGTNCWPSLSTIQAMAQVSRDTVVRCIEQLINASIIKREVGVGRRVNQYRINLGAGQKRRGTPDADPTPDLFDPLPLAVRPSDHKASRSSPTVGPLTDNKPTKSARRSPMVRARSPTIGPDSIKTLSIGNRATTPLNPPLRIVGGTAHDRSFDEFWTAYPRKEAKPRAKVAWLKALQRSTAAEIMDGLARFQFAPEQSKRPHPASWLNADRWADEQAPGTFSPQGTSGLRQETRQQALRREMGVSPTMFVDQLRAYEEADKLELAQAL